MATLSKVIKKWFPVPDDDEKAELLIVHLEPAKIESIDSAALHVIPGTEEVDMKWQNRREGIINAAVIDWKGLFKPNGKPLSCNSTNKIKALNGFEWFDSFVSECRDVLKAEAEERKKATEKN